MNIGNKTITGNIYMEILAQDYDKWYFTEYYGASIFSNEPCLFFPRAPFTNMDQL